MAIDKRIPSSNTIKKVLDEQSLVSKYLEEARNEIEKQNLQDETLERKKLRENIETISEKRDIVEESVEDLFSYRNKLYENILTSIIGKQYADNILYYIKNYRSAKNVTNTINNKPDSEFQELINELEEGLLAIEKYPHDETKKSLLLDIISNINLCARKIETNYFEKIKGDLGFEDAEVDPLGNLTGLGLLYNSRTDLFKSTVEFFKTDEKGNKKKLSEDFDLLNVDSEEIEGKVSLELIKDVAVEDGSEAAPYLIYTKKQFYAFLNRTSTDKHYKLMSNIKNVSGFATVTIAGNLDANGHTISFTPAVRSVKFTGQIKGKLNIIGHGKFFQYFYFPIFFPFNAHFGQAFRVDSEGELNIYVKLDSIMISAVNPFVGIFGPGRFLTVSVVGTRANESADKVNFYFYKTINEFVKDEYPLGFKMYLEDPNEETSLTRKSSDFQKKKVMKAKSLDFPDDSEYNNPILEKGKKVEISGKIIKEEGKFYIVDSNESEEEKHRIEYHNSATGYAADYSQFKMNYEDEDGGSFPFYPFRNYENVDMKHYNDDPEQSMGALQVLSVMAAIIVLKNLDYSHLQKTKTRAGDIKDIILKTPETEGRDLKTDTNILITQIISLREAIINLVEILESRISSSLEFINGSAQTFIYIQNSRTGTDKFFDNEYTSNLDTNFSSISGNVSVLSGDLGETVVVDSLKEFKKMESTAKLLEQECTNLTLGLAESITLINKTIENYLILFDLSDNYGNNFFNILKTVNDSIRELYTTTSTSFKIIQYGGFRSFESWEKGLKDFSNDGIFSHGQIFIGQELGLNAQNKAITSTDTFSMSLKYLVNDALISIYKKSLLIKPVTQQCVNVFKYEETLEKDYGIIINLDATYEKISTLLMTEIPELEKFENIDIESFLGRKDFFDTLSEKMSTGTSEDIETALIPQQTENKKIGNLLEMIFIKYLFNERTSSLTVERICKLAKIFEVCEKNFRNLLLDYYFTKVVVRIIDETSIALKEIEKNPEYKFKTYILESDLKLLKSYFNNYHFILANKRSILNKYIAVWMFNTSIHYSQGSSILYYIDGDTIESNIPNKRIKSYSLTKYLTTQTEFSREFVSGDGSREEAIWDALSSKWQSFIGCVKNVWDGSISLLS